MITCGLMIIMVMNQHQSGGRCDRLLQVTLTARFSIDPLSLYPHIHYTSTTSKTSTSQLLNLFSLFHCIHTSTTSKTSSSQHINLFSLFHCIHTQIGGEEEEILSDKQGNSQKMEGSTICPSVMLIRNVCRVI